MGGTGRTLGLRPAAVFLRVVLPQLRPAILGGALLVGLHCLSEFGAFSMLRFATFTTAIYDQYSSSFASAAANMLAVVLVACCLILVAGEAGLSGRVAHLPGRVPAPPARPNGHGSACGRSRRCCSCRPGRRGAGRPAVQRRRTG